MWSEIKTDAMEFRKIMERDLLIRRYHKLLKGEIAWEERLMNGFVMTKIYVITYWRRLVKRTFDVTASVFGIIFFLPVMGLIAVVIKMDSKGPSLFKQTRVGMRGRSFEMWKFRTMRQNAEAVTGPVWATEDDPRVTRLGNFLRKSHLDELPQLFNVLNGDMSIVGPRPERPYFVNQFRKVIPHYDRRLCAKPGITGLAQIKRRYDETLADVKKKLRYDALYVQKMCPLLDLKVVALTIIAVILRTGR
jgi:exopolysaccharide biosynthesis polyprenyl glycosylphosphotransferase